jgi:5-methylcytosine-specific restriction endonuclease McrA
MEFDAFFEEISKTEPISRSDAYAKYLVARRNAEANPKQKTSKGCKKIDYQAYLRSANWKAIRERSLRRANHKCELCGSNASLQVHHKTYKRLGRERMKDLQVLCDGCHRNTHEQDGKTLSPSTYAFIEKSRHF